MAYFSRATAHPNQTHGSDMSASNGAFCVSGKTLNPQTGCQRSARQSRQIQEKAQGYSGWVKAPNTNSEISTALARPAGRRGLRVAVCQAINSVKRKRRFPRRKAQKRVMQQLGKYGVTRRAQVPRRSFDKRAGGEASPLRMKLLGPASGVVANDRNR